MQKSSWIFHFSACKNCDYGWVKVLISSVFLLQFSFHFKRQLTQLFLCTLQNQVFNTYFNSVLHYKAKNTCNICHILQKLWLLITPRKNPFKNRNTIVTVPRLCPNPNSEDSYDTGIANNYHQNAQLILILMFYLVL